MAIAKLAYNKIILATIQQPKVLLALLFLSDTLIGLENKSYSSKIKKDIRIKFPTKETTQGFRDLSYNEYHFFVGLERNGSIPTYYNNQTYNRMIIGNLRNHRSTFIGLCMFKSI